MHWSSQLHSSQIFLEPGQEDQLLEMLRLSEEENKQRPQEQESLSDVKHFKLGHLNSWKSTVTRSATGACGVEPDNLGPLFRGCVNTKVQDSSASTAATTTTRQGKIPATHARHPVRSGSRTGGEAMAVQGARPGASATKVWARPLRLKPKWLPRSLRHHEIW